MSGRYDENDHEHYERPRRRTRPRTKERPSPRRLGACRVGVPPP